MEINYLIWDLISWSIYGYDKLHTFFSRLFDSNHGFINFHDANFDLTNGFSDDCQWSFL